MQFFPNPNLCHPLGPEGLAFTDRDELVSWSNTDGIRLYSLSSGQLIWRFPFLNWVAVAPLARLFFCFEDGKITAFRFEDRAVLCQWEHPEKTVHALQADPSGQYLVVCGEEKESWLYDCSSGHCLVRHKGCRSGLWDCSFSPDGSWLALVGDKTARVYRTLEPKPFLELKGHKDSVLKARFLGPDVLWTATKYEKERRLWKLPEGVCQDLDPCLLSGPGQVSLPAVKPGITVDYHGIRHRLMEDSSIRLVDCNSQHIALVCLYEMKIRLFPWAELPRERDYGPGHISPPSELVTHGEALLSSGGNLIARDPQTGEVLQCWEPEQRASQIALSADESMCAYFANYHLLLRRRPAASGARVHLLESWELILKTRGEHSVFQGWLHFSPHGRYLVSRSEGSRRSLRSVWSVWDTQNGRVLWTLKEWVHDGQLRFHPDGESFYCINEYALVRYCASTGIPLKQAPLQGSNFAPQIRTFSADRSTAVSYFGDHSLWVWQLDAELEVTSCYQFPFAESRPAIPARIALCADGGKLAIGRNDSVEILDLQTRGVLASLPIASQGPMNWDGPNLAVCHRDGCLTVWAGP